MVGNGNFQATCRICNKPLKLGIETAADEDGKSFTSPAMQNRSRTHRAILLALAPPIKFQPAPVGGYFCKAKSEND
jgi:hypothetical protein